MELGNAFAPEVREALGEYVYTLSDPTLGPFSAQTIFYVGKGIGDRCFAHARNALSFVGDDPSLKLSRIRSILAAGTMPEVRIAAHGLTTQEAHRLETLLIGLLSGLTNAVVGHYDRDHWLSLSEIEARYSAPLRPEDIDGSFLLVSLHGGTEPPYPMIVDDPAALRRRTLGDWAVSSRTAAHIDYVMGVYQGLIRTVARVHKRADGHAYFEVIPPENLTGRTRIRFAGELDAELKARWGMKRVIAGGKLLTKFGQNPTRVLLKSKPPS